MRMNFREGTILVFSRLSSTRTVRKKMWPSLKKTYRALGEGGRDRDRDHVMESARSRPRDGALFAVNMLVVTSGGGTYTFDEIRDGLLEAGFERIRLIRKGEHMDALVEGIKPQAGINTAH